MVHYGMMGLISYDINLSASAPMAEKEQLNPASESYLTCIRRLIGSKIEKLEKFGYL